MNVSSAFIETLRLTQFRSYVNFEARFSKRPVVFYGANGVGKTNILEAISLLSPGQGLRKANLRVLAHQNGSEGQNGVSVNTLDNEAVNPKGAMLAGFSKGWAVSACVKTSFMSAGDVDDVDDRASGSSGAGAQAHIIGIAQHVDFSERRQTRIDGKTASMTDLARLFSISWLTPAQDRLFLGLARERRQFFDRLCLGMVKTHAHNVSHYEKARTARSRLLADNVDDSSWYQALEMDLARYGALIAHARAHYIVALNASLQARAPLYADAFALPEISIEGQAENAALQGASLEDIQAHLRGMLADNRGRDRQAGRTLEGVHKTDFHVKHVYKNMSASACSTGEQKALLISLILAHIAHQPTGHAPILLLDEIAAHLDAPRREILAAQIIALGVQTFLSGTDKNLFSAFEGQADIFCVRADHLHEG